MSVFGHRLRQLRQGVVGAFIAAAAIGLVVVAVKFAPQWFASTSGLTPGERAEEFGRVRTATLAGLAGLLAALGAYYTHRTFGLNRAGQITERFTRAIDQLGRPEIDVRLGGIYALERVARDSRDDHPQVVEVLTAYVREHSPWPTRPPTTAASQGSEAHAEPALAEVTGERAPAGTQTDPPPLLATDVQAVMSVLARRDASRDWHQYTRNPFLDLGDTDLRHLLGIETQLRGVSFARANLQRATLYGADLRGAFLMEANLAEANLGAANLEGALAEHADFRDAVLNGANLRGAVLKRANLEGASLREAKLQGATLDGARYDAGTTWPVGFSPEAHGAEPLTEQQ